MRAVVNESYAPATLALHDLKIGESGAAPLAALRLLVSDPALGAIREAVDFGPESRVLLIATEGRTGA